MIVSNVRDILYACAHRHRCWRFDHEIDARFEDVVSRGPGHAVAEVRQHSATGEGIDCGCEDFVTHGDDWDHFSASVRM
jgi:hypothetical protein